MRARTGRLVVSLGAGSLAAGLLGGPAAGASVPAADGTAPRAVVGSAAPAASRDLLADLRARAARDPRLATGAATDRTGPRPPTVVVTGLSNPRQLSLDPSQSFLLVAEAGKGGRTCVKGGPPDSGGQTCLGTTGAISLVVHPRATHDAAPWRIVGGLLSAAGPDGSAATGSDGVSARYPDRIYIAETYAPPETVPAGFPIGQLGKLLRATVWGDLHVAGDIAGYEHDHDPDHQGPDSNPYAALALPDRTLVADAAANDVLTVLRTGVVSTFAVLPNVTTGDCRGRPNDKGTTGCDAVPTSLAVGPDGGIYVGGLASEALGQGRVWKLDPETGKVLATWTGLSAVTGVTVGPDNSLYASQLFTAAGPAGPDFTSGKVTRIRPDGSRLDLPVPLPAGLAANRFGDVFVSAYSIAPDTGLVVSPGHVTPPGQVWKLRFPAG